jgi:phosphotriesterase-related protein
MRLVNTTSGAVEPASLGRTLVHEHLHVGAEGMRVQWPHLFDAEADRQNAILEVRRAQEHGVQTICDPSCMDLDRNVHLNIAVARETGMVFVMATGVYGANYTAVPVFLKDRVELLTQCLIHDLEVGIQGTDVRAGFLKCAADLPGITPDIEMVHRAVARASLATGAPIMAHSNPAVQTGLAQMKLFAEEGVAPHMIQIAHTGDTADLSHIEDLLDTGCYVGMDRYGLHLSTERRNDTVAALVQRGFGPRVMLGHDSVVSLDGLLPPLLASGVAEADLDAMIGTNVHNWLAGDHW